MNDTLWVYFILIPVTAIAGFVRGSSGFGGPMILVPVLQFFFSPKSSVAIALIADLISNVRLLPHALHLGNPRVLRPMIIGGIAGIPIGLFFLTFLDADIARRIVSATLLASTLLLIGGWKLKRPLGTWGLLATGAVGGTSLGASGISLIVNVILNAGDAPGPENRANFIVWTFIGTICVAAIVVAAELTLGLEMSALDQALWPTLVLSPIYYAGICIGIGFYGQLDAATLRKWTLRLVIVLAVIGLI